MSKPMIRCAVEEIGVPIASVKVEYHPFPSQDRMLSYLRGNGIPLDGPRKLASLGREHGCSAAQAAIAGLLDREGVIVIQKPDGLKARSPI
jgi:2,5-diketo-D-gluconate reductase B